MREIDEQTAHTDERHRPRRPPSAPFARLVGASRFIVLLAVAAVLLVAMALFVLGAGMAVAAVWGALQAVARGDLGSADLTVRFLEIVSVMLKATIFYLVGVGFYSLFIAPLNLPTALGIETLKDLETKVISAVVVIMAVTFLEHFILWQQPNEILLYGATLAVVVAALVLFQFISHWSEAREPRVHSEEEDRARHELFEEGRTKGHVEPATEPRDAAAPDGRAGAPVWRGSSATLRRRRDPVGENVCAVWA